MSGTAKRLEKVEANCVAEITCVSEKTYRNPFIEAEVDAVITGPDQVQTRIPAFWAGGSSWRFRFASSVPGVYTWTLTCSDTGNSKLHGTAGKIEVVAYQGENVIYKHGPVRVAADGRQFEHADGTPFFWLGDTWWKNLCKRMTWEGFQELAADRKAKGFSVVQIVCGPYPDEGHFDELWKNEGGFPYTTPDFTEVNPEYFEFADRRISHLVDTGIVPAIVGSWGRGDCDGMALVGSEGMKRHWRHLIARYGAYPTIWIVAGESGGPLWTEVAGYVRATDFCDRPTTVHPSESGRTSVTDESAINFDMLQTGHGGWPAAETVISKLKVAYDREPAMPVVIGEHSYEQHMQTGFADVQRHVFWSSMLSGAAGLSYGAAGVWHASVEGDPGFGGRKVFDWTTWKEGMNFPGSTQLGLGKRLLEKYPWWRFETHPEWVEDDCFAAGIPGEVMVVYMPRRKIYDWSGPRVTQLEPGACWHAYYFDPVTGRTFDQGTIEADDGEEAGGTESLDLQKLVPSPQDWVLVLERK